MSLASHRKLLASSAIALLAICAAPGCGRLGMYDLYAAPAYWIDNPESSAPYTPDFDFNVVEAGADGSAWIAGDKYLLHAVGEQLEVVFANPGSHWVQTLRTIATSADSVWVGGARRWDASTAVIWRRHAGQWQAASDGLEMADRTVLELDFMPAGTGVGVLYHHDQKRSELARFDGQRWRQIAPPIADMRGAHLCQRPDGTALLALVPNPEGVIYRLQGDQWQPEKLPFDAPDAGEGELITPRIVCFRDGTVLVSAALRHRRDAEPHRWWLFRQRADRWQEIAFPEPYRAAGAFVVGGVSADDFWIAPSCAGCDPAMIHFSADRWSQATTPALPGGRRRGYAIKSIGFTSAEEGWAVGDDLSERGVTRGVVFRYQHGAWQYRPWSWSFWQQPLFGLLGD